MSVHQPYYPEFTVAYCTATGHPPHPANQECPECRRLRKMRERDPMEYEQWKKERERLDGAVKESVSIFRRRYRQLLKGDSGDG